MSKPRYRWWEFVKKMIRDYPTLKEAWNDTHAQSVTANLSGMPRGGSSGRTIESIALRQLTPDDQKDYDAVRRAIELTKLRPDGDKRIKLISYVYWAKKKLRIKDAALLLNISEDTAKRWHGEFVRLVGKCHGYHL